MESDLQHGECCTRGRLIFRVGFCFKLLNILALRALRNEGLDVPIERVRLFCADSCVLYLLLFDPQSPHVPLPKDISIIYDRITKAEGLQHVSDVQCIAQLAVVHIVHASRT